MTDKLNWGILSTAHINHRFVPAANEATRSELVAVASRNLAAAQEFAAKRNIPQAFGSYEELLASPDIKAVYIPLPNSLHHEWAIKAAQAGKHILCEKPLALTVTEVDEMVQAAQENQVVLLEAFMYRMHPQLAKLKEVIKEGLIGPVELIRAKFSFTLEDKNNIRLKKSLGGGSLWDVGCYPVSFAQAINEADPVEVFGWQKLNTKGTEIIFAGQLKFANGVIAQIDSGFAMPFRIGAEVIGENGVIVVSNPWLPDLDNKSSGLVHITPDDAEIPIPTEVKNPYLCEVEVIERAVLDGVPTPYTLTESRGNVATITALYKSAEQGEVVRVNED